MTLHITCPDCSCLFPLSAGFLTAEGKALGIRMGQVQPELAKSVNNYLRFHKPQKKVLSLKRSIAIANELLTLAEQPTIEFDGHVVGNSVKAWIEAMDALVDRPPAELILPLNNLNYLRAMVFKRAAQLDTEQQRAELDQIEVAHREKEAQLMQPRPQSTFRPSGVSPPNSTIVPEVPADIAAQRSKELAEFAKTFKATL